MRLASVDADLARADEILARLEEGEMTAADAVAAVIAASALCGRAAYQVLALARSRRVRVDQRGQLALALTPVVLWEGGPARRSRELETRGTQVVRLFCPARCRGRGTDRG